MGYAKRWPAPRHPIEMLNWGIADGFKQLNSTPTRLGIKKADF